MTPAGKARVAFYTGVALAFGVSAILAVLLENVALGVALGIATGIVGALLMRPKTNDGTESKKERV